MDIRAEVRQYIGEKVLDKEVATMLGISLEDTTPLITGGLIDSIGMLDLVRFIERRFEIEFRAKEVGAHTLDTIDAITGMIEKKLNKAA